MDRILLALLLWVALLSTAQLSYAGECIDSEGEYVAVLEAGPAQQDCGYALYCLSSVSQDDGGRWAGPLAANRFARFRADPLRGRIANVVTKLLKTGWADSNDNRTQLYGLAASRGIAKIDSIDVFDTLVAQPDKVGFELYRYLAILQDCRAVDFVASRYERLRTDSVTERAGEADDIVNCLYHIPCKRAIEVSKRLLLTERDPDLRARIHRVLERRQGR